MAEKKLKVLFASAEVMPFAKTGGLGDVAGALPKALNAIGCQCIVAMPLYGGIKRDGLEKTKLTIAVTLANSTYQATVFKSKLDAKTEIYFIAQQELFSRPNPYGTPAGDYPDNDARFTFFNRAVLELCRALRFKPDVIHVNDWHLGLVPVFLKNLPKRDYLNGAKSVLSLHNLAYQGLFPKESFRLCNLPDNLFGKSGVEMYGQLAFLKSGILFADALTAVSPTYAKEILAPELGFGLEKILQKRGKSLKGILNGIDPEEWNPETDRLIPHRYSRKNIAGKAKCRAALLDKFNLSNNPAWPVVGIVSRLIEQKGFDMVARAAEEMMKMDLYLVALGTGQPEYEEFFRGLQLMHPQKVGLQIGYDNAVAHQIEAGSDLFLMPSKFEPCGLNQMYSLAYGTVPIVRATGGLKDSVANWQPASRKGTGFVFKEASAPALLGALKKAVAAFANKKQWAKLVDNGMQQDFTWHKSAKLYLQLYKKVLT
ncbi:MAG: glycogen synthase GlgA [Nitrospinae bacterium]|nr:glycogen synthase GlgA [Nitrospinota bacterium]